MEKREDPSRKNDHPPELTVGDQGSRAAKVVRRKRSRGSSRSAPDLAEVQERIAKKAYELYMERGQMHGHDVDDWLEAERIVAAELSVVRNAGATKLLRRKPPPQKNS